MGLSLSWGQVKTQARDNGRAMSFLSANRHPGNRHENRTLLIQVVGMLEKIDTKLGTLTAEDQTLVKTVADVDQQITALETADTTLAGAITSLGAVDTQLAVDVKALKQKAGGGPDLQAEFDRIAAQATKNAAAATQVSQIVADEQATDQEAASGGSDL